MAFNATSMVSYVKHTYDPKFIENSMLSVEDSILKVIPKKTDGSGADFNWLSDADDAFNGSPDFAIAQTAATNNSPVVGAQFKSNWNDYAALAQLTSSIIGKTRNDDGAWQKALDTAMFKTMKSIAHYNAVLMQGRGWGEIGTAIASVSGSTFVPSVPSDITKFIVGMPLVFANDINTTVLNSATVIYVTAVVYTPGKELVTCGATLASVSAANTNVVFLAGARQNSATPTRIAMIGMDDWFPNQNNATQMADATVTSSFLSVDRTKNSRYYGTFIDATGGGSPLSAIIDGAQEAITIGNAKRLEMFCSKATFGTVAKDLQNAVRYEGNPTVKAIGTSKLLVYADGQAEAYLQVSRTTNDNQIWGIDPGQMPLKSIGGAPHIDMEDGLTMARIATSQGYEIRWFQQAIWQVKNVAAGLRIQLV